MSLSTLSLSALAAIGGALSHVLYFKHGEHHRYGPLYLLLSFLVPFLVFLLLQGFNRVNVSAAATMTVSMSLSYFTALFTSMLCYRAFFHPLRNFPGPLGARLSKLWHVSKLGKMDNYKQLDALYHQYGDFVRTGPNEIMVTSPDALVATLGPGSKCTKGPWYDQSLPLTSLHRARNKKDHDQRRRIWDRAFGMKALRDYESRVVGYVDQLTSQLAAFSGKPVNVSRWFNFYSFDVMGDLAFGTPFGMLQNGETHWALELLYQGMLPNGTWGPVPWVLPILSCIPGAGLGFKRFISWCSQKIEERKKMRVERRDIATWLLEASEKATDIEADKQWLYGDSRLIIVAGSDTTAATLTYIFYHLCEDPFQVEKLRAELNHLVKNDKDFDLQDLQGAPHLNGVINEALRLHPPVPGGVFRVSPPEGITIGGRFIPGNVNLLCSLWTMSRLESCFESPLDFVPERWSSKPEMVKNQNAFAPFSLGPYSCIGKNLALMELRTVVSRIITKFNVKFAPGEDGSALLNNSIDYFTLSLAPLNICFEARKEIEGLKG